MRKFYIDNSYCCPEEIKIREITLLRALKSSITRMPSFEKVYQLVSTRRVYPRYSVIPLKVMKNLAQIVGVPFHKDYTLATPKIKYMFEYKVPDDLIPFYEFTLYNTENLFREKYNIESSEISKKAKKSINDVDPKLIEHIKNHYIHISANYNSIAFFKFLNIKGDSVIGVRDIDKLLYANVPRYNDSERDSYKREIYDNNKK